MSFNHAGQVPSWLLKIVVLRQLHVIDHEYPFQSPDQCHPPAAPHTCRVPYAPYLDGKISREEDAVLLVKYNFSEKERALQLTCFFDRYRSFVINYNLCQELVRKHIEARSGPADNPEKRW